MSVKTDICGANTKDGICMSEPVKGKTRCRLHGGLSTGAKTPEGRARLATAKRAHWAEIKQALALYREQTAEPG